MQTYRAALAPFRMKPLHPIFIEKALQHARIMRSPGWGRRHAHEVTCPYCGVYDQLVGTIRIGAKEQITGIKMTTSGYVVPEARDRETEILIIHCTKCEACIDPLAYLSPAVWYGDKENVQIWDDDL